MRGAPRLTALVDGAWTTAAVLGVLVGVLAFVGPSVGVRTTFVTSGSMQPTFDVGALLITHQVESARVEVGDVVAVPTDDGGRLAHRVVRIGSQGLVLRGDANQAPDPRSYDVERVDRMVLTVPAVGRLAAWSGQVPWWLLAAGFGALALLGHRSRRPAESHGRSEVAA